MADLPQTMRSLVAPKACKPEAYELRQMPVPTITRPDHVLLRIHAVGMNTFDPQLMSGELAMFHKLEYPATLGAEGAGTVVAVGSGVKNIKVGDEVYGLVVSKPMSQYPFPGFASDYALGYEQFLLPKPPGASFEEAAALTGFVATAMQAIKRGLQLGGLESGGLEGKTVFIPGALSGTGSIAIQVAKNIFGAGKIISTVSTQKLSLVKTYLPGLVDQVVDYKTQNVAQVVGRGVVDFAVNTQRTSLGDCIGVINPRDGIIIDIAGLPSKETAKELIGADKFPWIMGVVLDVWQLYMKLWRFGGTSVKYEMVSGSVHIREELEKAGEVVALGKVKAIMRVVDLDDIKAVRKGCEELRTGRGGIGKLVLKVV